MISYLVIDGYNLLHEWSHERGEFINHDNLEEFRDKLIQEISNYAALSGHETVLVFDALHSSDEVSEEKLSGITVVYTGKDETADTYIERYLYTRPRHSLVILVTSDAAIQEMAILTGAQRVSSRQFLKEIEEKKQDHEHYGRKDERKQINIIGEHLDEDALELFESLRYGDKD